MKMMTIEVSLPQDRFEEFTRLAEERERSAAELLEDLAIAFLERSRDDDTYDKVMDEARAKYPGEYIAIHEGQIVAHHREADALLRIVKEQLKLKSMDVLIAKVDDHSELRVRHPRLVEP
jgi:hypothetical protein